MSFDDIKGQGEAIGFLKAAVRNGKVSHAYIFAGPKGCGRSLLAGNFAKTLNCEDGKFTPCDSCPSCRKIDAGAHPDVKWVRKEEKSSEIKIEQIRELGRQITLKPYEGKYKVYVIVDAELMNTAAANSFLKTLEEPPRNSVLILIAEEPKGLLPTIVSRCQMVRLMPIRTDELTSRLADVLEEFADDECIGNYSAANRGELSNKLNVLASWYRDLLVFRSTGDVGLLIHKDMAGDIKKSAVNYGINELTRIFESIISVKEKVQSNVNPKLALSALFSDVR